MNVDLIEMVPAKGEECENEDAITKAREWNPFKAVRIVKLQSNVGGSSYMFSHETRKGSCTART